MDTTLLNAALPSSRHHLSYHLEDKRGNCNAELCMTVIHNTMIRTHVSSSCSWVLVLGLGLVFQRPFVKRFALCYQTVVCPVCRPDCKPEGPLFSAEFVCLSVCLSVCVSLTGTLPFNVNRFWWNLVTRTLLWSAARDRATPFWNFQKII